MMTTDNAKNNLTVEELIMLTDMVLKSKRNLSEDMKQELYLYALEGARHQDFASLDIKVLISKFNQKLNKLILREFNVNKSSFIYILHKRYNEDIDNTEPIVKKELAQEIERFYYTKGSGGNLDKFTDEIINILFT